MSRFLVSSGYRRSSSASVTPYILERKLYRYIRDYLRTKDAHPDDIELFDYSLRDLSKEDVTKMYNLTETETLTSVMKQFFKEKAHLEVYKNYNI